MRSQLAKAPAEDVEMPQNLRDEAGEDQRNTRIWQNSSENKAEECKKTKVNVLLFMEMFPLLRRDTRVHSNESLLSVNCIFFIIIIQFFPLTESFIVHLCIFYILPGFVAVMKHIQHTVHCIV